MNQCLHRVKGILNDIDQEERGTEEEGVEGREGMEYSELLLSLSQHFISSDVHLFTSYLLNLSEVSEEGEKERKGEERGRNILHAHSLFLLFLVSW